MSVRLFLLPLLGGVLVPAALLPETVTAKTLADPAAVFAS